jgi:hypothetical protein
MALLLVGTAIDALPVVAAARVSGSAVEFVPARQALALTAPEGSLTGVAALRRVAGDTLNGGDAAAAAQVRRRSRSCCHRVCACLCSAGDVCRAAVLPSGLAGREV